jgi:hypothetical protein
MMKKLLLLTLTIYSFTAASAQIALTPATVNATATPTTVTATITDTDGFVDNAPTDEFAVILNGVTYNIDVTAANITASVFGIDILEVTFTVGTAGSGADVIAMESGASPLLALYQDQNSAAPLISSGTVLPVELTKFEAKKSGDFTKLSWATSLEINNDFFSVMRSLDGKNFEEIDQVSGLGTSLVGTDYDYTDDLSRVEASTVYYRLAQTDFDGTVTEFDVVSVAHQTNQTTTVGNVSNQFGRLQATVNTDNAQIMTVSVIDLSGRLIDSQKVDLTAGANELNIDMDGLTNGLYFVNFRTKEANITERIMN